MMDCSPGVSEGRAHWRPRRSDTLRERCFKELRWLLRIEGDTRSLGVTGSNPSVRIHRLRGIRRLAAGSGSYRVFPFLLSDPCSPGGREGGDEAVISIRHDRSTERQRVCGTQPEPECATGLKSIVWLVIGFE